MTEPVVTACGIGREAQPLVTLDRFSANPDGLRALARHARFGPAGEHYPGIRAPLPAEYMRRQMPIVTRALREIFGRYGPVELIDASFSIVTTRPEALSLQQRVPHCDAFTPDRIALIHYLSPEDGDGTAFYRHRETGFETIDELRRPAFFESLDREIRDGRLPAPRYIAGNTELFEQIALAEARYDRALLYPSFLLHSGAIAPDSSLSADPQSGRLTITAFFSVQ